jgi:ActR/RegA family two-component response regulator
MFCFERGSGVTEPRILIVDDDPSHLKLYSWILGRGNFVPVSLLVNGPTLAVPEDGPISLAVVDYRLGKDWTAVQVIQRLRQTFPDLPIVMLSDFSWLPEDVAPYVSAFVRKGEPQELLDTISNILAGNGNDQPH